MKFQSKQNLVIAFFLSVVLASCSSSKEKVFAKEAAEQNRLFPTMIDNYTRIDSLHYNAEENIFRYYYTLSGDADDINFTRKKRDELLQNLPSAIKREPGMSTHRQYKVGMEYIYYSDSSKTELFRVKITPDMYK